MQVNIFAYKGKRYPIEVPDTLDLADRAMFAVNALTGMVDREHDHEIYFTRAPIKKVERYVSPIIT